MSWDKAFLDLSNEITSKTEKTNTQPYLSHKLKGEKISGALKFIDSITLGENTVNFDTELSTTEMIEIFESLPLSVSAKITEEIQKVRKIEIESIESDVLPEGASISIDASIFTSE